MTHSSNYGSRFDRLDNVIAFPGARRHPASADRAIHPRHAANRRAAAITGADLNARLLILLGICTTGAAIALSAVHVLLG